MLTTNLLKEIKKESVKGEAHDAEIIKQVQLLLDTKGQEEKTVLEKCGLDHHIKVAENITGESIERQSFFEKYGQVLTEDMVEKLCYKYALRCLHVEYYEGNIGPNVAGDINRFVEKHGLQGEMNSGNFKRCLYVMAPKGAFKLEKKPVDPVLFYCPNQYSNVSGKQVFIPVSKWGTDFTIIRRLYGLYNRPVLTALTVWAILATIITFIAGDIFAILFIVGCTAMFAVIMYFVCGHDDFLEGVEGFYYKRSYNPFSTFNR